MLRLLLIILALAPLAASAQTSGNPTFGTVKAGQFIGPLSGNAATASALAAARTISTTGDAACSFAFDGSANAGCTLTLAPSGASPGSYGSATTVPAVTVDAKGRVTGVSAAPIAFPVTAVAGRTGAVALAVADVAGAAPLASPAFSGTVSAPAVALDGLSLRSPVANAAGIPALVKFEAGGANNAILGSVTNNAAACTSSTGASCAFPTAVSGYGNLLSAGNTVFGLFGRADCRVAGICTNEVNSFNFNADAPGAYPFNRSFATTDTIPVALTVGAAGSYKSAAGIEIVQEGAAPNAFQHGVAMRAGSVLLDGIFMDATASTGPATNVVLRNTGQGSNLFLDMQTMGAAVPGNAIIRHRDASGNQTFKVSQSGDVISAGTLNGINVLAQSGNYPTIRINNTAGGTDAKQWEWIVYPDGSLHLRANSDDYSSSSEAIAVTRSGTTATSVNLKAPTLTSAFIRTADPTTSDIPAGQCADWNNTTAGTYKHVCNFGGTLRSVAMN